MSYSRYPAARAVTTRTTDIVPRAAAKMAGVGAIIGGTAAAKNMRRVGNSEISKEEAVMDTIKGSARAGLATAAATAAVTAAGATGFFSLLGIVVVATGAKYLWDSATKTGAAAPKKVVKSDKNELAETDSQ